MAIATRRLSSVANGVQLLSQLAQRRDMAEDSRPSARVDAD